MAKPKVLLDLLRRVVMKSRYPSMFDILVAGFFGSMLME